MKLKSRKSVLAICIFAVLLIPVAIVFAQANSPGLSQGEIFPRDLFTFNQSIKNDGTVKGDLIALAQSLASSGRVEGDILCAASDINISGPVDGDARMAGANIKISGNVGKNANVFSGTAELESTSSIGGNLLVYASSVELAGTVKGYSRINGGRIILSGRFDGDVDINIDDEFSSPDSVLHILSGTEIRGKLTYKGVDEAFVETGASIGKTEWIKSSGKEVEKKERGVGYYAVRYARMLASTVIYFLIAMLFYRLFPGTFTYQGKVIAKKPLNVFGIGLAAIGLIIAAVLTFIFLLAATILIATPGIAVIFAVVMGLVYTILFYFSAIPVSMWLGNTVLSDNYSVPVKFGLGLLTINVFTASLGIMGELGGVGIVFSALRVIALCAVGVMGIGALIYSGGLVLGKLRENGTV